MNTDKAQSCQKVTQMVVIKDKAFAADGMVAESQAVAGQTNGDKSNVNGSKVRPVATHMSRGKSTEALQLL